MVYGSIFWGLFSILRIPRFLGLPPSLKPPRMPPLRGESPPRPSVLLRQAGVINPVGGMLCVYICIYKYVYIQTYSLIHTHICVDICMHAYRYMCVFIYIYTYVYMCVCICVCVAGQKIVYMCA